MKRTITDALAEPTVTDNVTLVDPTAFGVPDTTPVEASMVSPVGKVPDDTA